VKGLRELSDKVDLPFCQTVPQLVQLLLLLILTMLVSRREQLDGLYFSAFSDEELAATEEIHDLMVRSDIGIVDLDPLNVLVEEPAEH